MQTIFARGAERVPSILTGQLAGMTHDAHLVCTRFVRGDEYPLSKDVHLEFIPEANGSRLHSMFVRIRNIRQNISEIRPNFSYAGTAATPCSP